VADAGIGKTRLATTALEDWTCRWRGAAVCRTATVSPTGRSTEALLGLTDIGTTAPGEAITEGLAALVGDRLSRTAVASAAASLGLTDDVVAEDPGRSLRDLVLAIAAERGLVLVVDDLHDAEGPLLDLLASLARAHHVPLLVVGIARSELLHRRPDWGGGVGNALTFTLDPLGPEEVRALLASRLEGPLDRVLEERLAQAAGGNPLYLEEVVTVLLDGDDLRRGADGTWRTARPDAPLAVPVSIQALLAARIDALPRAHRAVLGRAAVCGLSFTRAALRAVTPEADRDRLAEGLEALLDHELLRLDAGGYAFRHRFARDAVYAGLSRRRRAELHERLATWLDAEADSPQSDEFVAYHLQRALDERAQLDPEGPELARLRVAASARLDEAGHRAFDRRDVRAALRLLEQALATVDGDGRRAQLLATRGRALAETGDFETATRVLADAVDLADRLGDRGLRTHTRISELWARSNLDLGGWVADARAAATEAIDIFTADGDEGGLARAWGLLGEVHYLLARYEQAGEAITRAEEHASAAGDLVEAREAAIAAVFAQLPGPRHLDETDRSCRELLDRFAGDRPVEARVLHMLATVRALRGDGPSARAALAGAVERFEELGLIYWSATSAAVEGVLELLVGTPAAAEVALRRALDALAAFGDRAQAATIAAQLACALAVQRTEEIADLVTYAQEHGHPDDLECRVHTLLAAAHLASSRGDAATAAVATEEAVEALEPSDAVVLRVDALLARASALHAIRRASEGATAARRARELADAKGYTVGVRRAERWISGGPVSTTGAVAPASD
jgi:tetratricopeptide (TPR) repeat protein